MAATVCGHGAGPAVGEVVAGHAGDHGVAQPHPLDRLRPPGRARRVERQGVAGVDLAEPAGPGAALAVDHEGGGALRPALVDVGTARLLAHRDQAEVVDRRAQARYSWPMRDRDPQPVRLARARCRGPASGATPAWRRRRSSGRSAASADDADPAGPVTTSWRSAPVGRQRRDGPRRRRRRRTSAIVTVDALGGSEVTARSAMPARARCARTWRGRRSTLSATPCSVRRRPGATRTRAHPDGGDLPRARPVGARPTPPGSRRAPLAPGSPRSASVSITTCSRRWTWPGPAAGSSGTVTIG